jgi:hypothetical protein
MKQDTMEHNNHGNVYGTIVAIVLYFISHFTLSDGAALAAIFAGLSTGGYNIYKFYKDQKNGNPKSKKRTTPRA